MTASIQRLGRGLTIFLFTSLCIVVAAYAFAWLYLPHSPANPFARAFAVSGFDVPAHFFGAGLALLLTPLQLSGRVRRRAPRVHRVAGWLAASGIVIAAIAALSMARHTQGGAATGIALACLALTWIACVVNGLRAIMRGDRVAHRRWMSRVAALTFAAVTLRVILGVGGALGLPFMPVYVFATWSSWPLNLAAYDVGAWWLARRRAARVRVPGEAATAA